MSRGSLLLALSLLALLPGCNEGQRAVMSGLHRFSFPVASMEPTIHAGEQAFSRDYTASENPRRGDVVVFRYPKSPKTQYCKRVVALPGETIEIRDKKLIVNGSVVTEPYAHFQDPRVFLSLPTLPEPFRSRDQLAPHILSKDQYFVLGDNRDFSSDSRYWGPVKRSLVLGKVVKAGKPGGTLREIR